MSIYTCLDLIYDARAGKPEAWRYLITNYIPVIRWTLAHYYSDRAADTRLIERVLMKLRDPLSPLYANAPISEREFVAELRQQVLAAVESDRSSAVPEVELDLELLTEALEPLTATERQFLWIETMGYSHEDTARMINIETLTVKTLRERADDLLRQKMDRWTRGLVAQNGHVLGRLAGASKGKDCLPPSAFLDTIDGRITWKSKREYENHLTRCWYCVDHFSRIREADFALRENKPLSEEEGLPYRKLLGVPEVKRTFWEKVLR